MTSTKSPYRLHNIEDLKLREYTREQLENARSRTETYYKTKGFFIATFKTPMETPMEDMNVFIGYMGLEAALKKYQQIINSPNHFQAKFDRFYDPKNLSSSRHTRSVYGATLNFHDEFLGEEEELIWFSPALYEKDRLEKIMEPHQDLRQQLKELALTPEELYQFINE